MFYKKGLFKNITNFTGKHLFQVSCSTQVFFCGSCKNFKSPFTELPPDVCICSSFILCLECVDRVSSAFCKIFKNDCSNKWSKSGEQIRYFCPATCQQCGRKYSELKCQRNCRLMSTQRWYLLIFDRTFKPNVKIVSFAWLSYAIVFCWFTVFSKKNEKQVYGLL